MKKRGSKDKIESKLNRLLKLESEELKELKQKFEEEPESSKKKISSKELEKLREDAKRDLGVHPLKYVTERDIGKGLVGAFAAVVSHFVFLEGVHVGEKLSDAWIILLYLTSLLLGAIMLYVVGFRTREDKTIFYFIPIRLFVIYFVALGATVLVLVLYQQFLDLHTLFKQVGALSIPAMLGASIADLLGKEE